MKHEIPMKIKQFYKLQTGGVRILFSEYFTSIPGSTLKKHKLEIIENALWVSYNKNLTGLCPWLLRERGLDS